MRKWRRGRRRINETRWDWEGEKPYVTLNLTKQTEGCWGEGGWEKGWGYGHWGGYVLW